MKFKGMAVLAATLASSIALASPAAAAELISNGNFANGLTGWTTYTTANGTVGTPFATAFDVTGDTIADTAARLQVGQISNDGMQRGGGLFQQFTLTAAGVVNFSTAFAAQATGGNSSGGRFSLLIDGIEGAAFDTAGIAPNTTERGTLAFSSLLASGLHTFSLQATRPYGTASGTPAQYFTNASAQDMAAAVPEPASWAMMILGMGAVGGALRRRSKVSTSVKLA